MSLMDARVLLTADEDENDVTSAKPERKVFSERRKQDVSPLLRKG